MKRLWGGTRVFQSCKRTLEYLFESKKTWRWVTRLLLDRKSVLLDRNFLKYNSTTALANFVQPIFTLFLPLLALEHGASVFEIGLIGGASSLVYAFMPFVMGRFSDRGQARTLLIILSLALLSTILILYRFAENPVDLILLRIIEGLGWAAFWPSIDSAVTHDTRVDPSKALAIFNLSWSSTSALGPLVGAFVVVIFSINQVFIFNAIFLIAALLLNLTTYSGFRRSKISGIPSNDEIDVIDEKTTRIAEPTSRVEASTHAKILKVNPLFYVLSLVLCTDLIQHNGFVLLSLLALAGCSDPDHRGDRVYLRLGEIHWLLRHFRNENQEFPPIRGYRSIRNIFVLLFFVSLSPLIMLIHSTSGHNLLCFLWHSRFYLFLHLLHCNGCVSSRGRQEENGGRCGDFRNLDWRGKHCRSSYSGIRFRQFAHDSIHRSFCHGDSDSVHPILCVEIRKLGDTDWYVSDRRVQV